MKRITDIMHHLFVPGDHNGYRAKALHTDFLTTYLMIAVLMAFSLKTVSLKFPDVLGFATDISVSRLFELSNQKRTENGLSGLNLNAQLSAAAQKKAEDMFSKNYWAHFAPDGGSPWNFIMGSGYQYEFAGENLAKNFLFSQGVVDAWMNSPSHRENILRKEYSDVGFAIVNGILNGEETTLVVQMFGRPLGNSTIAEAQAAPPSQPTVIPVLQATVKPTSEVPSATPVVVSQAGSAVQARPLILAQDTAKPKINLLPAYINISFLFFLFLGLAIVMDFYFAAKMNLIHVGGKHIAHFIFILFIIAGLYLVITKGSII